MTTQYNDTYRRITEIVIQHLEKGQVIWRMGWSKKGLPRNVTTGLCYRGWNTFFLNFIGLIKEYAEPCYLTFKQAQARGGRIRKGETGYPIVYWAKIGGKEEGSATGENPTAEQAETYTRLVPKCYTVFNIAQTEGIDFALPATTQGTIAPIQRCEEVIEAMPAPPRIVWCGDRACYRRTTDTVHMPERQLFHSAEDMYATLFHELAHSTGHSSRLNRRELIEHDGFGGKNYSKEELTAELTASFLCGVCGIEQSTIENSAAYIKGWLKSLRNDRTLILKAAAHAQKAANYIQGIQETVDAPAHTDAA